MFKEGQFTQVQYGLTVFITEHEKDGSMSGILLNDERNPKSKTTITSEKGRVVYTEKGPRIILVNGIRQEINPGTKQFSSLAFDRYSVDFGGNNYQQEKEEGVREKICLNF